MVPFHTLLMSELLDSDTLFVHLSLVDGIYPPPPFPPSLSKLLLGIATDTVVSRSFIPFI